MVEQLLSVAPPKQSHAIQKIHGQIMEHAVLGAMNKSIKSANPPHAVIAHSKSFRLENSNKPDEISICRRSMFRDEFDHTMPRDRPSR
jgi:hypothetical protein